MRENLEFKEAEKASKKVYWQKKMEVLKKILLLLTR